METEDFSFIIPQKEIRIRKSWGDVKPETKIHKSKKKKREQNNIKREIEEAIYGEDE